MYLYSLLLVGSFLSSALAAPTAKYPPKPKHMPKPKGKNNGISLVELQTAQPLNGLVSNSNVTLKYAGLGVGVQNYSCASTTSAPKSIGAIATLFDVTSTLRQHNDVSSALSTKYLQNYEKVSCLPNTADLSDHACEEEINRLRLPVLGEHYFASINGAGVPTFDLDNGALLSSQKIGDVLAPSDAYDGSNGVGAVDWLFLTQDGSGRSVGLTEVYRINTAGGSPPSTQCSTGVPTFSVKYAAEYWFYG